MTVADVKRLSEGDLIKDTKAGELFEYQEKRDKYMMECMPERFILEDTKENYDARKNM